MNEKSLEETAARNLRERLAQNPYPGRGIVIGRSAEGTWIQVYWIMGRSPKSRNRVFVCEQDLLRTRAADPSRLEDPALVIYPAMRRSGRCFIVSNGAQTDAICAALEEGRSFAESLLSWRHEPDPPHFTPRISGCLDLRASQARVQFSLIAASPFDSEASEHHFFHYSALRPGYGYAITTYRGDGTPLPSFAGPPYLLPLEGEAAQIADTLWKALDEDNRISLALRRIEAQGAVVETRLINRYEALQPASRP